MNHGLEEDSTMPAINSTTATSAYSATTSTGAAHSGASVSESSTGTTDRYDGAVTSGTTPTAPS